MWLISSKGNGIPILQGLISIGVAGNRSNEGMKAIYDVSLSLLVTVVYNTPPRLNGIFNSILKIY